MRPTQTLQVLCLLWLGICPIVSSSPHPNQITLNDQDASNPLLANEPTGHSQRTKSELADLRDEYRVPALLAASSFTGSKNEAIHINVTGVRRQGTSTLATAQDQWHLGSLTKAMTATLIALLIKNGHFTWSTPIPTIMLKSPHLRPILPFVNPAFLKTPLSAILSHRAGISIDLSSDARLMAHLWAADAESKTKEDRLMLTKLALSTAPKNSSGTFVYDNLNYIIAGAVIDAYSPPKSWEQFMQEALFDPLDMSRCGFGPNPESSWFSVKNPWPHLWGPRRLPFTDGHASPVPVGWVPVRLRDNPPAYSSAGTVHCPTESYAAFLRLHASRGLLERRLSGRGNPLEPGPVLPLPPSTVLDLRIGDFEGLHTPVYFSPTSESAGRGDETFYTPGGWLVAAAEFESRSSGGDGAGETSVDLGRALRTPTLRNSTYRLMHEGSNTMNDAMAWVDVDTDGGRGSGDFRFAATNVGGMSELLTKVLRGIKESRNAAVPG